MRPTSLPRWSGLLLTSGLLLAGCATPQNPDPLEALNRKTFALNEGLDKAVLKPVATAYQAVLPQPARTGVSNFFSNLGDPWSGINRVLQGQLKDGLSDFARFGVNSTVGLLGLIDVASDWGMPRRGDGFGDTLRVWGVGGGAYLVLPLLGPSDLRSAAAFPVNSLAGPGANISDVGLRNSLMVLGITDKRAQMLAITRQIDELAFDKYLFVRDAYLQIRTQREAGPARDADFEVLPSR